MSQALSCQAGLELILSHNSWLVMTASSFLQGLTLLPSLTAGKRDRLASKRAAGTLLQASDRLAADKGASSTKPVLSNKGSEEPSPQPQQQPQSSSHAPAKASGPQMPPGSTGGPKAACSSDCNAGPRQPSRPPGGAAPTSEKYPPKSVQFSRLQALWHKANCPGEATFRVFVAIAAVLEAATQFAEGHEQPVSRVRVLLVVQMR